VLLSLLLSAARPALAHVGKIRLLSVLERHLFISYEPLKASPLPNNKPLDNTVEIASKDGDSG
jgi:hypothetical protein